MRKNLATSWETTPEISVDYSVESDREVFSKEKDIALNIGDFSFLETKVVLTAGASQTTTPEIMEISVGFDESIELGD